MTISTQTSQVEYTANGVQTSFDFDFKVMQASDMKVYINDALQTSGYTVNGVENNDGGTVVFTSAPANGSVVKLKRVTAKVQELVLREFQKFPAESVEKNFDKIVSMIQELVLADSELSEYVEDFRDFVESLTGLPFLSYTGELPPPFQANGMRWYKPSEATTFVYYIDGDSGQWVQEPVVSADSAFELQLAAADSTKLVGGVQAGFIGRFSQAIAHTQRLIQKLRFSANANIVVLSDSTGNADDEWVYKTAQGLASRYPTHTVLYRLWSEGSNNYGSPVTIQTGSAGVTLTVWNAAISGALPSRFMADNLLPAVRPAVLTEDPDLIFVNYGHNGGPDINIQYALMSSLINELQTVVPLSPIVIIGQNPVTTDNTMRPKVEAFRQIAVARGCGFIDVHAMFIDTLKPLTNYYVDDVHPNEAGSTAWANLVLSTLVYAAKGEGGATNTSGNTYLIDCWDNFRGMTTGSLTNLVSISRDTTLFESAGESLKVTALGGATQTQWFALDVVGSVDITKFRNKNVTVKFRVRIASGADFRTGRLSIYDGINTVTTPNGGANGSGWYDQVITMKVHPSATYVRAYIYLEDTIGGAFINVDRITVSAGMEAKDGQSIRRLALQRMDVFGGSSGPISVVRNSTTGGHAVAVLDTASGTDNDNGETQYVVSYSADGVRVKQRGDTHPRVHIRPDGSISVGSGSALASQYFFAPANGQMRLVGADFFDQDDMSHDLGISGKAWRRLFAGNLVMTQITAANALNRSIFVDSADGALKYKDGGGVVRLLY